MSQIELTLKPREIEETIDLYFYRPLGYVIARWLEPTEIRPTAVTLASILVGVVAGRLLYYTNVWINVAGMIAFVIADLLDSVDGQLARLKGTGTRFGRILDGVAGAFIFTSMYFHLALRLYHGGASSLIFPLALGALLSQAIQNSMADYYRNAYVVYGTRGGKGELDSTTDLRRQYDELKRGGGTIRKALLRLYINYTARQELLTPSFQRLRRTLSQVALDGERRNRFSEHYRHLNRPLLKYMSWIATNLRVLIIFALLLLGRVIWYFWFDVIALNLVMAILIWRHERNSQQLMWEFSQEDCNQKRFETHVTRSTHRRW